MTNSRTARLPMSVALICGLAGCASLPRFSHWVRIRPIKPAAEHLIARQDDYYASATAAMGRRDYAQALDMLQAARARKADDVRVLNAFGVVYDKLGRFDLSDRYYAQAKALDPTSSIIANNIAYSATLRGQAEQAPLEYAQTPVQEGQVEARPVQVAQSRPTVIRLGFAQPSANPTLAGRPLEIADASGRNDGAEPVRRQLIRLGWSSSGPGARAAGREARTTITYPTRSAVVARALARTLPSGIRLVDCGQACQGVRLVIGADSVNWSPKTRASLSERGQ